LSPASSAGAARPARPRPVGDDALRQRHVEGNFTLPLVVSYRELTRILALLAVRGHSSTSGLSAIIVFVSFVSVSILER
jgi:hypothetical protein